MGCSRLGYAQESPPAGAAAASGRPLGELAAPSAADACCSGLSLVGLLPKRGRLGSVSCGNCCVVVLLSGGSMFCSADDDALSTGSCIAAVGVLKFLVGLFRLSELIVLSSKQTTTTQCKN